MNKVNIGIYQADGTLLGYKADTFWTLTHNKEEAKSHKLDENGEIPENIIDNLNKIVTRQMGLLGCLSSRITNVLEAHSGLLVGFESEDTAESMCSPTSSKTTDFVNFPSDSSGEHKSMKTLRNLTFLSIESSGKC